MEAERIGVKRSAIGRTENERVKLSQRARDWEGRV